MKAAKNLSNTNNSSIAAAASADLVSAARKNPQQLRLTFSLGVTLTCLSETSSFVIGPREIDLVLFDERQRL
jgi:hypothetical protein